MTSRVTKIIVYSGFVFGCSCIASLLVWKYVRRKNKKSTCPYNMSRTIYIVETHDQWNEGYSQLMKDLHYIKVLGLDCEWVLKNKVALLQLASATDTCILVRLNKLASPFPKTLKTLLADKSAIKVGVAVVEDGARLERDYGLKVNGCVDLRHFLRRVRNHFYCPFKGLQGLAKGVLGVDLDKNKSIRCGNWEIDTFSNDQVMYAAKDAAVAVEIFIAMVNAKLQSIYLNSTLTDETEKLSNLTKDQMDEEPSQILATNYSKILDVPRFQKLALSMCQGLIDCSYATRVHHGESLPKLPKQSSKMKEKTNCYSTRQRPLWDNCKLEAPDGTLLCTCDTKKALWYLEKELADKMSDNPLTVRLRFEPSNRPQSERNYYLQEKENVCVVCGYDKDYIRKFIVPSEYRRYFPEKLKDHSSHDVLLLCTACHRKSCESDIVLRLQLAQECNAPLESGASAKIILDADLQKVRSAARALKINRKTIPSQRIIELEEIIKDYYGVHEIVDDLLEDAASIDPRSNKENFSPHGKKVVDHFKQTVDLLSFQARWRQHFLDTMEPKFLPAYWSVDYIPECWIHQMPND